MSRIVHTTAANRLATAAVPLQCSTSLNKTKQILPGCFVHCFIVSCCCRAAPPAAHPSYSKRSTGASHWGSTSWHIAVDLSHSEARGAPQPQSVCAAPAKAFCVCRLEATDRQHRYGSNLAPYHAAWTESPSPQVLARHYEESVCVHLRIKAAEYRDSYPVHDSQRLNSTALTIR